MKGFLIIISLVASIYLIIFFATHFSNNVVVTHNNKEKYFIKEEETNISHILFGIGGSAKTWHNRSRYTDLWWRPNVTREFVWLDQEPHNESWPETSPPYRVSQDTSEFEYNCWFGNRSAIRIARIVKESFELGLTNVRCVEQNVVCSYNMACGGGGIAINHPLVAELVKILDGCINRYHYLYGSDQRIGGCMAEIGVPLTHELGFHQVGIINLSRLWKPTRAIGSTSGGAASVVAPLRHSTTPISVNEPPRLGEKARKGLRKGPESGGTTNIVL
ncbi:hypothetical protein KY289_037777 [Solanum tuberosum]|nr:hypothetical protein KY289_037777 [Solanum tuberosum]